MRISRGARTWSGFLGVNIRGSEEVLDKGKRERERERETEVLDRGQADQRRGGGRNAGLCRGEARPTSSVPRGSRQRSSSQARRVRSPVRPQGKGEREGPREKRRWRQRRLPC
ncbi:hypothetical protein M6B38_152960 [Iris pallida]|uniref:Uncharacterized protein n=1 Tax=Iris pallida TaxID=29817 RepID=A0AAX6F513_IRIPA|nr:hypothetical protein M6B38_152960 [Iris pallida]